GDYTSTGVELSRDMTSQELTEAVVTLRAFVEATKPGADYSVTFTNDSQETITGVRSGVYLIAGTSVTVKDGEKETRYDPTPYLIFVQNYETVTTNVKYTKVDHYNSEAKDYKVVKHWLNDGKGEKRPVSIKVRIMKDGELYKDVVLSENNDWTYTWTDTTGSRWSVYEYTQVKDYKQTLKEEGNTFIISNKYIKVREEKPPKKDNPKKTDNPKNPNGPKTGDPADPMWLVICLASAGAVLLLIYARRRSERS
ncbi:MAG: Cna B-type domain-containing protein, partial [Anaerovoracaceae bacterium]